MVAAPTIFQSTLLPASWRGIPFFVLEADVRAGQRAYTHEFPFRDVVYSEPLGREARHYQMNGYLVGDDVNAQYLAMMGAIEADGPDTLVHPSLGAVQVVCIQAECTQTTAGRYVEIKFQFVEAGTLSYPTTGANTQATSTTAASNVGASAPTSFNNDVNNSGNATVEDITISPPPSSDPAVVNMNAQADAAISSAALADQYGF